MKRLFSILWTNAPGLMFLAIFMGVITGACNTAILALINKAMHHQGAHPLWLSLSFLAVCIFLPLSFIGSQYVLVHFSQKMMYNLRMKLVEDILRSPLRKQEELGSNALLATLTADVTTISNALVSLPGVVMQITIVLSVAVYLSFLYWPAAIGMVVTMILGLASYQLVRTSGTKYFRMARENQDDLFQCFESLTRGTKELQLHEKRSDIFINDIMHNIAEKLMINSRWATVYFSGAASLGRFLFFGVIGLFVFVLPAYLSGITSEVLSGYTIALLYLFTPLEVLTGVVPMISNAGVSLKKVQDVGAVLEEARVDAKMPEAPPSEWRSLELVDISHAYHVEHEERSFIMGPINLKFKPGELVFLVGGNGSGKTTLAKLILGLYIPEGGVIKLDGKEVDHTNRSAYRQLFSAVFVDFYLFETLIGIDHDSLDERARQYLEILQLDHKVTIENGRLSTTNLSQGQRKRLALMTAFLEDRPIYLFDEWAADQDPTFKKFFYRKLLPDLKARDKTVIAISHDDAYYNEGDRLIKLDYGQIKEDRSLKS